MRELVFLLEERSARVMLESLLPRLLSEGTRYRCIHFEGKQDLEKQLTRRIRGYQNERARYRSVSARRISRSRNGAG